MPAPSSLGCSECAGKMRCREVGTLTELRGSGLSVKQTWYHSQSCTRTWMATPMSYCTCTHLAFMSVSSLFFYCSVFFFSTLPFCIKTTSIKYWLLSKPDLIYMARRPLYSDNHWIVSSLFSFKHVFVVCLIKACRSHCFGVWAIKMSKG